MERRDLDNCWSFHANLACSFFIQISVQNKNLAKQKIECEEKLFYSEILEDLFYMSEDSKEYTS